MRPHRTISSGGYVYVRAVGHPRANNTGSYVFEHILVMEKKLGRYLTKEEIVHHKDGNKQNNTLDNLELMDRVDHLKHHGAAAIKHYWEGKKRDKRHSERVSLYKKGWWEKNRIDITGQKFGAQTIVGFSHSTGLRTIWRAQCTCGKEKLISRNNLRKAKNRCTCNYTSNRRANETV